MRFPHEDLGTRAAKVTTPLVQALMQAEHALAGDSNDDEHDALLALVEALRTVREP